MKLPRTRYKRLLAKQVLRYINLAKLVKRRVFKVKRGDFKHLVAAFTIGRGYKRRMDVKIALILKIFVDGKRGRTANSKHCIEHARAWTQIRNVTQKLHTVRLFLKGIGFIRRADDVHARGFKLKRLTRLWR